MEESVERSPQFVREARIGVGVVLVLLAVFVVAAVVRIGGSGRSGGEGEGTRSAAVRPDRQPGPHPSPLPKGEGTKIAGEGTEMADRQVRLVGHDEPGDGPGVHGNESGSVPVEAVEARTVPRREGAVPAFAATKTGPSPLPPARLEGPRVRTCTTVEGDTVFDIARRELGRASRWVEIYELNRAALGKDLNRLAPGTQLTLPAAESSDPPAAP
jgi:hypothetical protein